MKLDLEANGPKPEFIKGMFDSIAGRYDRANDLMTFGLARRWRKQLVNWSDVKAGESVIDCATGTGDLAFDFKKVVGEFGRVQGSDFSKGMLEQAPRKAQKLKLDVSFELCDVTQLPHADNEFDVASIAYGIRNVHDPLKALKEMARVVKPGGRVMVLETGALKKSALKPFIEFYFEKIVPRMGGFISGNRSAYEYLNQSSSQFPCAEDFVALLQQTGSFSKIEYRSIMGGASFIYKATK